VDESRQTISEGLRGRCTCSIEEAAAILGIGRSTAYAAAHDGTLPVLRMSKRLLVSVPRLLAMIGIEQKQPE
jgi:excisionase family DNA binding protein